VLERGYALAQNTEGRLIRNAAELAPGDVLRVRFARGNAETEVKKIELDSSAEK
jgi:exodeoxyribonuclease VII large subunit